MRYVEPPHLILRKQLIANQTINSFAKDIGEFLAYTLFGSSGYALSGGDLRQRVAFWSQNTALCALTEKVIFTDPYTKGVALNSWTKPYLDSFVDGIQNDTVLKIAASYHKQLFTTHTQALLHGDLHTGSVMVKEDSTFVIDPEFAFYGPMGFDVGAILANLYLAYFSKSIADDENIRDEYSQWILSQIELLYNTFVTLFLTLWNNSYLSQQNVGEFYVAATYPNKIEHSLAQRQWLTSIYRDTLGFIGSKMLRRIVGIAHVEDLKSIADDRKRSIAEKRALLFARTLILASHHNNYADQGLISFEAVNEVLAETLFTTPEEELIYPSTD
jgi:5-methylthioribose kinase